MNEFDWIRRIRRHPKDQVAIDADDLFDKGTQKSELGREETRQLSPVERINVRGLSQDEIQQRASEMRGMLIDFSYQWTVVGQPEEDGKHRERLQTQANSVLNNADLDIASRVLKHRYQNNEVVYPVQVTQVEWEEGREGVVIALVGFEGSAYISILVAFQGPGAGEGEVEDMSLLQKSWSQFSGDFSVEGSLEAALSGRFADLVAFGFCDPGETDSLEPFY